VINAGGQVLASGVMADSTATASIGGLAMGTYSVMLNDSKGSQSLRSLTLTVDLAEALNIGLGPDQTLPTGGEIFFDASRNIPGGAAQSYQWQGDNGFNATTPTVTVREPGVYTVTLTSTAGCIFRDSVKVEGEGNQHITVYPSPSTDGNFTVSVSLPETGDISVGIYDLNGNKQQEMTGRHNTEYRLPGHLSTPGVYMITVKTPHGIESKKLLIL
jgi:hypothetical protein